MTRLKWLTEDARLQCDHVMGRVQIAPSQDLVTIAGRAVLVAPDPLSKGIIGCPNAALPARPCLTTLAVRKGYSDFITVEGKSVCLDTVTGRTDGTPPGVVDYTVSRPGQEMVSERVD
jgi:hypothetical protein